MIVRSDSAWENLWELHLSFATKMGQAPLLCKLVCCGRQRWGWIHGSEGEKRNPKDPARVTEPNHMFRTQRLTTFHLSDLPEQRSLVWEWQGWNII